MNKKTAAIVIGALVLVVGSIVYVAVVRGSHYITPQTATSPNSVDAPSQSTSQGKTGLYTEYDASKLAKTEGSILLFFHASWCPKCRAIEQSIYDQGIPENVTVYKVDYDTNQALRQRYGVTVQTTFVRVDQEGNKLASYVAYDDPTFSAVAKKLLP